MNVLRAKQWVEFIALGTDFSSESFKQWQWSQNSTHYILYLWSRLVSVTPFVRASQTLVKPLLENYSPRVFQSYVDARLQSAVDCVNDESLENPLENEEQVQEQLEQLPNITRYQYEQAGNFLKSRFDPIAAISASNFWNTQLPNNCVYWKVIDLVGLYNRGTNRWAQTMASTGREGHEKTDAIFDKVFKLMQLVDRALVQTNGTGKKIPS